MKVKINNFYYIFINNYILYFNMRKIFFFMITFFLIFINVSAEGEYIILDDFTINQSGNIINIDKPIKTTNLTLNDEGIYLEEFNFNESEEFYLDPSTYIDDNFTWIITNNISINTSDLVHSFKFYDSEISNYISNYTFGDFDSENDTLNIFYNYFTEGDYDWDWLNPDYLAHIFSFSVDYSTHNDLIFNVSKPRVKFNFYNKINGNPIEDVYLNETTTGQNYFTDGNTSLTLYRNQGTYNYIVEKNHYLGYNSSFTLNENDSLKEIDIYLNPIYNLTLYDEKTLGIFNISGVTNLELRITCQDDTEERFTINETNFDVEVDCLYRKFKFIVEQSGDVYYRTLYLDENNLDFNVYLLNVDTTTILFNSFNLYDLLDTYENPRLTLNKYIDDELVQITGDYADIQGIVSTYTIFGDEYIFKIESDNLPERNLGFYSSDTQGEKTLRLFDLNFEPSKTQKDGSILLNSYINDSVLFTEYKDLDAETNNVVYTIRKNNEYGEVLYTTSSLSDDVVFSYVIPEDLRNTTLYLSINYDTEKTQSIKSYKVKENEVLDLGADFEYLDLNWVITIFLGFIALIFTISTAPMGSLIILSLAGFLAKIGWFEVSWAALSLGIVVSLFIIFKEGDRK